MPRPLTPAYLGVTGIVTLEDAAAVAALPSSWSRLDRRLMVGILASAKTWRGEAVPNRRYPPVATIPALVAALPATVWPVLHVNAPRTEPLVPFLLDLLARCPGIQGVQLNLVSPAPADLAAVRAARPDLELILQVNRPSVPSLAPDAVDAYVRRFAGVVQHVLLDLSGGTGRTFDRAWLRAVLVPAAWSWLRDLGIRPGLAGGLGAAADAPLRGLMADLPPELLVECSLDAESGLRVPIADPIPNERHQDRLDPWRLARYVHGATNAIAHWAQIARFAEALRQLDAAEPKPPRDG